MKKILLFVSIPFFLPEGVRAQCLPPTSASVSVTNLTCSGSGSITVNSVSWGAAAVPLDSCRFMLYDAANTTVVAPVQPGTTIGGLDSGTYNLHIYRYCSGSSISSDYTQQVHIGGSYTPLDLGEFPVTSDGCNTGSFTVSPTGGYGTYSFCMVDSTSAPFTPTHYVSPPQASGTYTNLPPGTYYLRVYDQCYYKSRQVVIDSTSSVSPFDVHYSQLDSCGLYEFYQSLTRQIPGDSLNHFWIAYPNGTVDTLPNTYASDSRTIKIPFPKLGATYPATFTLYYKNACNQVFSTSQTYNAPQYWLPASYTAAKYSCANAIYNVNTAALLDSANNLGWNGGQVWTSYSLDGGATWKPYSATTTDTVLVPMGGSRQIIYRGCGQDYTTTLNAPAASTFSMDAVQESKVFCGNNGGIRVNVNGYNGDINKIQVSVISKPASQPAIAPFFFVFDGSYSYDAPELSNLAPGSYALACKDECGGVDTVYVNVQPSHDSLTITPVFACNTPTVDLDFHYRTDQSYAFYLMWEISDTSGNLLNTAGAWVPTADVVLHGYTPRIFKIKVWKENYNSTYSTKNICSQEFIVDGRLPATLSLNKSSFAKCTNDPATGMVIAQAEGGIPPYSYSLYVDTVTAATQVVAPQSNNVFTNLDVNKKYIITVTDQCSGATYWNMFSNVQPVVGTSTTTVPCTGQAITLSVSKNSNLFYQWTKNGTAIAGATDTFYTIPSVSIADSGVYRVNVTANNCLLLSASTSINPNVCGIPFPLPLDLLRFNGSVNAQNHAVLNWQTAEGQEGNLFTVLYSTDGRNFYNAGMINGTAATTYSFVHKEVMVSGKVYYKLMMTESTGVEKYSTVIALQAGKSGGSPVAAAPIPFTSQLNVSYSAVADGSVALQLADVSGRVLKQQQAAVQAGVNMITVTGLEPLPAGTYFLKIAAEDGQAQTIKVQK